MPKDNNSIERYRKMRRGKRLKKRLLFLAVLFILGSTVYLTSPMWMKALNGIALKISTIGSDNKGGFPMKLTGDSGYHIAGMGDNLAVVTDAYAYLYNADGSKLKSVQHGYANPVLQTSERHMLVYDRGGYDLLMESQLSASYKKKLDEPIVFARISSKEYLAVVTQSNRFASSMLIFDSQGNQLFQWDSVNYKIQEIAFDQDSEGCIVSAVGATGGQILSTLYSFRFDSDKEQWSKPLAGTLILSLHVRSNGNIAAVGDNKLTILNTKGEEQGSYPYSDLLVGYANSDELTALLLEDEATKKMSLAAITALPKSGDTATEAAITPQPLADRTKLLLVDGKSVVALTNNAITSYDASLKQQGTKPLESEYTQLVKIGQNYYALGYSSIDKLALE